MLKDLLFNYPSNNLVHLIDKNLDIHINYKSFNYYIIKFLVENSAENEVEEFLN